MVSVNALCIYSLFAHCFISLTVAVAMLVKWDLISNNKPLYICCFIYCIACFGSGVFGIICKRKRNVSNQNITNHLTKFTFVTDIILIVCFSMASIFGCILYALEILQPSFVAVTLGFGILVPFSIVLTIFFVWAFLKDYYVVTPTQLQPLFNDSSSKNYQGGGLHTDENDL
eukprot:TRINITY_DN15301_c0_g1_i1.p1 TRINITY_DN15301_c0_g1~~TRINITY_DN15301_c0_g1_i1.p1  ORF type:complete len:172 (+),score=11.27 TRINITY_DN15301_c0_g1_i1:2-517(+)